MATKRKSTKTEGTVAKVKKPAAKGKIEAPMPAVARRKSAAATQKQKPKTEIATELIALRAYFIGEKRAANGQPGDSLTDWLEAERQLIAEK